MPLPLAGRGRFGPYRAVSLVHDGDKSSVYKCEERPGAGHVAIKLYKRAYDQQAQAMERKYGIPSEAEVGLRLNPPEGAATARHPIVLTLGHGREFGRRSGGRYIVLEFIEGVTLKRLITCGDPRVMKYPRALVVQCCQALRAVHRAGFVFRDFGPQNIIVRPDLRLKLIDLGFVAPAGLAFPERSGTPTYMAPEQINAQPLGPACDIYALGVLIYELLTGQPPFTSSISGDGEREAQARRKDILQKHLEAEAPPLPDDVQRAHPALCQVAERCLRKNTRHHSGGGGFPRACGDRPRDKSRAHGIPVVPPRVRG